MGRQPKTSQYGSVDPAPPQIRGHIIEWKESLVNKHIPMFQRMRNVFALRNDRTDEACLALCNGFLSDSALLRHEAAEALGAIGDYSVIPVLQEYLGHELPEISESCEVAIDLLDWTKSKEYDVIDC